MEIGARRLVPGTVPYVPIREFAWVAWSVRMRLFPHECKTKNVYDMKKYSMHPRGRI